MLWTPPAASLRRGAFAVIHKGRRLRRKFTASGWIRQPAGESTAVAKRLAKNVFLACLKTFPSFHAKRELLAGTLNMPVSGGGWIVTGLVFEGRL
jgi:hypothetical protein